MKAWIAVRLMMLPGTGTVAAKRTPIAPDMQSADFGAYPSDVEELPKAWADTRRRPRSSDFPAVMSPPPSGPSKS
jgi:hypothetical protein